VADSVQILKVNPFHQQLALYMISHPSATLSQTARHFNYSPSYISIIRNSDAFKVYYQGLVNRQFETLEPILQGTQAVTELALEKLASKLDTIGDQMTPTELREIADMGLKRLGFGADLKGPSQVNINAPNGVVVVDRGDLAEARRKMAEVHGVGNSPKQLAAPIVEATVLPSDVGAK
jgi:hypothetical protein